MIPHKSVYLASSRHIQRHPWLLVLSFIGIALGVAVVVAIDLANTSALRAFEQADQTLTGKTTHRIVGGPGGVDEKYYVALRLKLGLTRVTPVIEGYGVAQDMPGYAFKLLGVDSFSDAPFRNFTNWQEKAANETAKNQFTRLITEPASVLISRHRADVLGLKLEDQLRILLGEQVKVLRLIGYIPVADERSVQAMDNLLLMDIATAQEVLDFQQRLSRIDLIIPDQPGRKALLEEIAQLLPPGAQIISSKTRSKALSQMTAAFRINLSAMSLLALMVGLFIIYNGMSFSVVQRREMFGVLRVLGVTGKELKKIVYSEAFLLGIVGTVFGLLLGIALGYGLLGLVTRTVNDLYAGVENAELRVSFFSLAKGIVLGIGATFIAAILPAREATHIPPQLATQKMHLESTTLKLLPRLAVLGVILLLLATAVLFVFTRSLPMSFAALFLIVIAYSLLVPQSVTWISGRLRSVLGAIFGVKGHMALHSVSRSLSRTSVAMAALTVAVATTIGIAIMIGSFRDSVTDWITQSMRADIYLSVPRVDRHVGYSALAPSLIENIRNLDEVKAISQGRRTTLQTHRGEIDLLAFELPEKSLEAFKLIAGDQAKAWQAFSQENAVIVSEPYAYRNKLSLGDHLQLPTRLGLQTFEIAGVYSDYASERGRVVVSLKNYRHYWRDSGVSSIGIYLRDGVGEDWMLSQLREGLAASSALSIRTKSGIRDATLVVFDRTFAITEVLRILTIIVAFVGILSALMALQLERARELAMLRAIGLTPRELWLLVVSETGIIGLLVGLMSLPLGLLLSTILIHVINRRSFGWSMTMSIDVSQIAGAVLLAVIAAVLAGLYPAYRMAKTRPALALRGE